MSRRKCLGCSTITGRLLMTFTALAGGTQRCPVCGRIRAGVAHHAGRLHSRWLIMPMSLSRANTRISELMKFEVNEPALGEGDRLQPEVERLSQENLALRMEMARLTQDNQDLRESAKIWIRLYDAHRAR